MSGPHVAARRNRPRRECSSMRHGEPGRTPARAAPTWRPARRQTARQPASNRPGQLSGQTAERVGLVDELRQLVPGAGPLILAAPGELAEMMPRTAGGRRQDARPASAAAPWRPIDTEEARSCRPGRRAALRGGQAAPKDTQSPPRNLGSGGRR